MSFPEGDAQAYTTADAVARRSYGSSSPFSQHGQEMLLLPRTPYRRRLLRR